MDIFGNVDIKNLVSLCEHCCKKNNRKLNYNNGTREPWQRIQIDFASPIQGTPYFIIVDAYTRFTEAIPFFFTNGIRHKICLNNQPGSTGFRKLNVDMEVKLCRILKTSLDLSIHLKGQYSPRDKMHKIRSFKEGKRVQVRKYV